MIGSLREKSVNCLGFINALHFSKIWSRNVKFLHLKVVTNFPFFMHPLPWLFRHLIQMYSKQRMVNLSERKLEFLSRRYWSIHVLFSHGIKMWKFKINSFFYKMVFSKTFAFSQIFIIFFKLFSLGR